MQRHTHARNITITIKVKLYFTLLTLSTPNVRICKRYVYDSTKDRYDMILYRDHLIELGLYLIFYEDFIEADNGPFKGSTATMVYLCTYIFKDLNIGEIKSEELFTDASVWGSI